MTWKISLISDKKTPTRWNISFFFFLSITKIQFCLFRDFFSHKYEQFVSIFIFVDFDRFFFDHMPCIRRIVSHISNIDQTICIVYFDSHVLQVIIYTVQFDCLLRSVKTCFLCTQTKCAFQVLCTTSNWRVIFKFKTYNL